MCVYDIMISYLLELSFYSMPHPQLLLFVKSVFVLKNKSSQKPGLELLFPYRCFTGGDYRFPFRPCARPSVCPSFRPSFRPSFCPKMSVRKICSRDISQTVEDNVTKFGGCVKGNVGVMYDLSFFT